MITYDSINKIITVSNETVTFEDLYNASVSGGWDVIEKPINNTYILHTKIYLATNTTLADIEKTIIFDGLVENAVNVLTFFVDSSSVLQLGLAYSVPFKTGYMGCTIIIMNAVDNAGYTRPSLLNYGTVYLYDTDWITKRTQGSLLWGNGKWVMWGTKFAGSNNEVNFEGIDNNNNDIANCLISRQSSWGCRIDFTGVTFLNTSFIELGASRINYRECIFKGTYQLGFLRGDGSVNYCNLFDCDIDNYNVITFDQNIYYKCDNAVTLYNSVKPTILDSDGNSISGATISLYDKDSNLQFSLTSDVNGTIESQDVMVRNYQAQGLTAGNYVLETDYSPFTITIEKDGYETYTSKFDLEAKYRDIITLSPPEYVYVNLVTEVQKINYQMTDDNIQVNKYEESINVNIEDVITEEVVIPETLLRVYGENWNGISMTGHIGGTVAETGVVESISNVALLNNKKSIKTTGSNRYLTFSTLTSTTSDYVAFGVYYFVNNPSNLAGSLFDCYNDSLATANLRLINWFSNDTTPANERYWAGWGYGTTANTTVAVNCQALGENQTIPGIRMWLFENGVGKYYLNGNLLITNSWIPTELKAGQRRRMNVVSGSALTQHTGHLSLHRFDVGKKVNRNWINDYGRMLATFYNLTWNDIT